jgi:hypothetical protein
LRRCKVPKQKEVLNQENKNNKKLENFINITKRKCFAIGFATQFLSCKKHL